MPYLGPIYHRKNTVTNTGQSPTSSCTFQPFWSLVSEIDPSEAAVGILQCFPVEIFPGWDRTQLWVKSIRWNLTLWLWKKLKPKSGRIPCRLPGLTEKPNKSQGGFPLHFHQKGRFWEIQVARARFCCVIGISYWPGMVESLQNHGINMDKPPTGAGFRHHPQYPWFRCTCYTCYTCYHGQHSNPQWPRQHPAAFFLRSVFSVPSRMKLGDPIRSSSLLGTSSAQSPRESRIISRLDRVGTPLNGLSSLLHDQWNWNWKSAI